MGFAVNRARLGQVFLRLSDFVGVSSLSVKASIDGAALLQIAEPDISRKRQSVHV